MNCNININWNEYLERYINFIKVNNIKKFFELDIDSIVGYEKVKEYRYRLEKEIGLPCIPVWHRSRGLEEYFRLCNEYSYIAIGGIAIRHIKMSEYKYFTYFINEAHKRKAKVHGLGITAKSIVEKYHFDTVDSSAWTVGGRYGNMYIFNNGKFRYIKRKLNKRVKDVRDLDIHNLHEFLKYQEWAECHL